MNDAYVGERNFSDVLKVGKVVPVHKNVEVRQMNNFRPINSQNPFDNIFEKVIY